MADTWSVPTQTVAHKRVMQLRQLASIIRRRAMSCNKLPQEKPAGSKPNNNFYDEDIRPRTLRYVMLLKATSFARLSA